MINLNILILEVINVTKCCDVQGIKPGILETSFRSKRLSWGQNRPKKAYYRPKFELSRLNSDLFFAWVETHLA
jgi:hypothetical protein